MLKRFIRVLNTLNVWSDGFAHSFNLLKPTLSTLVYFVGVLLPDLPAL